MRRHPWTGWLQRSARRALELAGRPRKDDGFFGPGLVDYYNAFSGDRLTDHELREFYAENNVIGELLGIPAGVLPRTPEAVEDYVRHAEREIMQLTPAAPWPLIDDLVALAGFESWGIRQNARRITPLIPGRAALSGDVGLERQWGKGGTLGNNVR